MKALELEDFDTVWLVDFEFSALPGERPLPICLVAEEFHSGTRLRVWQDELHALKSAPYGLGKNSLLIAYYASAELGCHLALNWALPAHVCDLFAEFRNHTNGLPLPCGAGLLGALAWYGLPAIGTAEKGAMRELVLRGGPWTKEERAALLDYCESDVVGLKALLAAMRSQLDLSRALLRGRYMKAAASIEYAGVPLDGEILRRLRAQWSLIQEALIERVDADYRVFDGRTFKVQRFSDWLKRSGVPWPQLASGGLDLSDNTFREMARSQPLVAPLRELRVALSQMRLADLAVGADGRNRCLLSAFRARTGRNQPSNSRFIFGPAVWLRSLIKAPPGSGLAYVDWSQQEFGIAAALSGDTKMMAAYASGDPYLEFAKQAGAVPRDATKLSHKAERDQFKACVLAVQYGMGPESLAQRIGQPAIRARELLGLHRSTYHVFWQWSDAALDQAMLHGKLWTVFGWSVHATDQVNPRFLRNFPMQGNGAEMLRLACCLMVEAGITICAPVHDAVLIEAPSEKLAQTIVQAQSLMSEASAIVLDGFRLRTDVERFDYPNRYCDARGETMWRTVNQLLHPSAAQQRRAVSPR